MLREKEQQLKAENLRYQTQIDRLNDRIKGLQVKVYYTFYNVTCICYCYLLDLTTTVCKNKFIINRINLVEKVIR